MEYYIIIKDDFTYIYCITVNPILSMTSSFALCSIQPDLLACSCTQRIILQMAFVLAVPSGFKSSPTLSTLFNTAYHLTL